MCRCFSVWDQRPPVESWPEWAPQPAFEASVKISFSCSLGWRNSPCSTFVGLTTIPCVVSFSDSRGKVCPEASDISSDSWDATEKVSYASCPILQSSLLMQAIQWWIALITDFFERRWNISWSFVHLFCVGFTRAKSSKKWYPRKSNLWEGRSSDLRFTTKPKSFTRLSSAYVCEWHSSLEGAWINQSSRYWCSLIPCCSTSSFTSLTRLVKTRGAVARPKGRLTNW